MFLLLRLSLRNLLRSKRRNLFLGLGIAIGFMILIVADSFSQGLSDILLNRVVINFTGHIEIMGIEKAGRNKFIIRDKPLVKKAVLETLQSPLFRKKIKRQLGGLKTIRGNAFLFTTAIGTKSSQVMIMGRPPGREFIDSLTIAEGNPQRFLDPNILNPVIISKSKAKQIGVRVGDTFRSMFQTIYGQFQTANFTVVALTEGSDLFSRGVGYGRLQDLKRLLGYRPWETGSLQVIFKGVRSKKFLKKLADSIYRKLIPHYAVMSGKIKTGEKWEKINIIPFKRTPKALEKVSKITGVQISTLKKMGKEDEVLLPEIFNKSGGVAQGERIIVQYPRKFVTYPLTITLTAAGFFPTKILDQHFALMHEDSFYKIYYNNLPKNYSQDIKTINASPLKTIVGKAWILLPRGEGETDIKEELFKINKMDTSSLIMSVRTMYETAGDIIKMEVALKSVTLIAVAILFLIVLIGVVNSLRMSVKERTREIGTIRAIGATRGFVLFLFLGEVFWLTLISAAVGLISAFLLMQLLSSITFHITGPFSILFTGGHIHFLPTIQNIVANLIILLIISLLAAYFPARGAAKMPPSEALRHYE